MNQKELLLIIGGSSSIFSGTFFNAISRCIETLIEAGRLLGTSIRYWRGGKTC